MTAPTSTTSTAEGQAKKQMTAAEAAKRVKRPVIVKKKVGTDEAGNDVFKDVPGKAEIAASEVLAFKEYGDEVVVVTKDGQKFNSADA